MSRKMLINARTSEEVRIAIVDDSKLENYQVEVAERGLTRGNIYRGTIVNIQTGLNAAFIEYGAQKHGFLAIQDVVPEAYYKDPRGKGRPRIDEVLERGKPVVVQVTKDPEGSKGAALTTNLSLAGRYLVLTPFDDTCGVSRKVEDEKQRKLLKERANSLERPLGCGVIVRTNALDQNKEAIRRDFNALLRLWKRVGAEARQGKSNMLLYSDQDLILGTLRDHLDNTVSEVLTDDEEAHAKVREYMRAFMPRTRIKAVLYEERTPLFSKFDLERQIERIYDRTVGLPSGGSLVIDRTEALVAVDVNTGRASKGGSQEETALKTNLESATEVARQLRLRDIGGLIVVDFIDMRSRRNQSAVERTLREAMKVDKARSTVGRLSPNGLLEINRQRIQQALLLRTHRPCPTCQGTGRIASPEMVGLSLLRRIEERAAGGFTGTVRIGLHPELSDAFQNGRRREIAELEAEFDLKVDVTASNRLHRADLEIEWLAVGNGRAATQPAPLKTALLDVSALVEKSPSRRRGRRRKPAAAAAKMDASQGPEKDDSTESPKDDAKASGHPRKRRRRGPRKPARAAEPPQAGSDNGQTPPVGGESADRPESTQAVSSPQNGSGADAKEQSKPRASRSRRRRPRRRPKPDTSNAES